MHKVFAGVAALALLACWPADAQTLTAAQRAACRVVPRALVRPVAPQRQAQAAAVLQGEPAAALEDAQAADWIGVDAPPGGTLADRLLKDQTDALLDRRDSSIGEHALKWSVSEQATLDALLQAVAQPHAPLRPVLVRAAAGPDAAGGFDAAVCGDGLAVRRLERGEGAAAPVAVIVFVERAPVAVQTWREAAAR